MKPKSILDPTFRYISSDDTDVRKTFARIRREQRRLAPSSAVASSNLRHLQKPGTRATNHGARSQE